MNKFQLESKNLAINIQPKPSSANKILFIAYISTGNYKNIKSQEIVDGITELDESGNEWTSPVYGDIILKKFERIKVSTSISVPAAFYDAKTKTCKKPFLHLNDELKDFKTYVQELYHSMVKSGITITEDLLKTKIKVYIVQQIKKAKAQSTSRNIEKKDKAKVIIPEYFGKEFKGIRTDLISYVENKIKEYKNQDYYISKKGKSTISKYTTFKNNLTRYSDATNFKFDLLSITVEQVKEYIQWIIKNGKPEDGSPYTHNYLSETKKEFKGFISKAKAHPDKIPVPIEFEEDDFWIVSWEKENDPYLTYEQLDKLRALKFDEDQKMLELVRNAFLVGCSNGMSIIDLQEIKHLYHNNTDGYYWSYTREKINKGTVLNIKIKIPLRPYFKFLIDLYKKKYNEEFNFKISDGKFNKHIKTVCMLAGLKEPFYVETKNTKTGKLDKVKGKLWENVFSKTMRKTFASNEIRVNLTPLSVVKRWTGHKSEAVLQNYIQLSEDDYFQIAMRTTNSLKVK